MEDECVIGKLRNREALCVYHHLKRINALTYNTFGRLVSLGEIRETQEIAGKKKEEISQTAAARAQGKIPRASVPSQSQTGPQTL
jgi:hypothetical protein